MQQHRQRLARIGFKAVEEVASQFEERDGLFAKSELPLDLLAEWTNQQAEIAINLRVVYQFVELSSDTAGYRLYHRSMAEFLALDVYSSKGVKLPNSYHTPPLGQHEAIIHFYFERVQKRWQDCDVYGLKHLADHLKDAEKHDELLLLLLDFDWLQGKLDGLGPSALIKDFNDYANNTDLLAVQRALRRSAHILYVPPEELSLQLISRLPEGSSMTINDLRTQASRRKGRSWLRPLSSSLSATDNVLVRILQGHTEHVTAVAATPDGRYLISGSWDKTLRVWDFASGKIKWTLRGHEGWVTSVGITTDGLYAVSASLDRTLRVWNLATAIV